MKRSSHPDPLERAVHAIIILLGIALMVIAYYQKDPFLQNILIGIGSNLTVVTIVFIIFEAFRRREAHTNLSNKNSNNEDPKRLPPELEGVLAQRRAASRGRPRRSYGVKDDEA